MRGKWLMTLAFDSDKEQDEIRFAGVIDPDVYYTVYADRSERRYDAASLRRLYLKLERPQFYALFGDYETGIDEPELARYVRAFNGVKAEYRTDRLAAIAFAADAPTRHQLDEIQGNGLSGPYVLGTRDILANSERISIEVRDRLRSDLIVERRMLTRHIDYDIDYLAGTLRFANRSSAAIPGSTPNSSSPITRSTASVDASSTPAADWPGVAPTTSSRSLPPRSATRTTPGSPPWLVPTSGIAHAHHGDPRRSGVERRQRRPPGIDDRDSLADRGRAPRREHRRPRVCPRTAKRIRARPDHRRRRRHAQGGFRRQPQARRALGHFGEHLVRRLSRQRRASHCGARARRVPRPGYAARAGITMADDRLADGRQARSTILQLGGTKRLFNNRLELDAQTELPIGTAKASTSPPATVWQRDTPRLSAVALVGTYEIADGETIDTRTARLGFDLQPWAGARIALSGNLQNIAEYGARTFARSACRSRLCSMNTGRSTSRSTATGRSAESTLPACSIPCSRLRAAALRAAAT